MLKPANTSDLKVQLLASNAIDNHLKLAKLLTMQLNLIKKLNTNERVKRSTTIKLLEKVIIKLNEGALSPQWRLLNTTETGKYDYTVSYFKRDDEGDMKEYPLYQVKGDIQLIATSMVGSGVSKEEVKSLFLI